MLLGLLYIVLASVAFGFSPVFATEIMGSGVDAQSLLVYINAFTALGAAAVLLIRRIPLKVTRRQLWQLIVFSAGSYGLTEVLLVNSYRFLPIGLATMFHFIYPVIVTVIMVVFFKEKISILKISAIIAALSGLLLILDLSGNLSLQGAALAVTSGFAYASYVVANHKCAYRDLPALVVIFYTALSCGIVFALFQFVTGRMMVPPNAASWLLTASSGLVCHLFAILMLISAVRKIGASNAAVGNLLEPMTSLIAGALIFSERFPILSLSGCALVLLAIVLIALDGRRAPVSVQVKKEMGN